MNTQTAKILCAINSAFYRDNARSFSATRSAPWLGWSTCLEAVDGVCLDGRDAISVLDLACGNLRFEDFFEHAFPDAKAAFHAVDNCDELLPAASSVRYRRLDVISALLDSTLSDGLREIPPCDLSVSFGFLHHVPGAQHREDILSHLVRQTRSGGYAVVSLWQFMRDPNLAKKAYATHVRATEELGLPTLDAGDYLLGWKNLPGAYRYCHSFSEAEIDALVASVAKDAVLVRRFASDGRTGTLNAYLVFRVR